MGTMNNAQNTPSTPTLHTIDAMCDAIIASGNRAPFARLRETFPTVDAATLAERMAAAQIARVLA